MNDFPNEINLLIINNLDDFTKINFISCNKRLYENFNYIRTNEILDNYIINNCKNITQNQKNSIIKNNLNNKIKLNKKIDFLKLLNNNINKRYSDG